MKQTLRCCLLSIVFCLSLRTTCAQEFSQNRSPAVAGSFYAGTKTELQSDLRKLFDRAQPSKQLSNIVALIVPHAGYAYSGEVAASAFNQLDPHSQFENIFILGPSHRIAIDGAAVYTRGNYEMPLGTVPVNTSLAKELLHRSRMFIDRPDAHQQEHCIEVTIPFLQYHLKKPFTIVPIVIGTDDPASCRSIAEVLRPYFVPANLFIISTDFSHYPSSEDARALDAVTGAAVCSNSTERLLEVLWTNAKNRTSGLATSMCGWPAVFTLLAMTEGNTTTEYHEVQYKNSGDIPGADRSQVVGYHAIAVTVRQQVQKEHSTGFQLSEKERKELLRIARSTVEDYVSRHQTPTINEALLSSALKTPCGAFVTLKKHRELRGCIGRFDASDPLYRVVQNMGIAAATEDYRFSPVQSAELSQIDIEISVLTPMKKISSIDEIQLGTHGIYIKKGGRAGTFLPQVATETGWTKEEFLGHCAQDKAGIGWDGWKNAEVFIYEALVFGEKEND